MYRYDIINLLIKKHNYKSYLEIGVRNPKECLDKINCELKHGVDPGVESKYEWSIYSKINPSELITNFNVTSDEFFETSDGKVREKYSYYELYRKSKFILKRQQPLPNI